MPQQPMTSNGNRTRRQPSGSWMERKIRRIRSSREAQKQLLQLLFIVATVLTAFALGFYFFGPNFSGD